LLHQAPARKPPADRKAAQHLKKKLIVAITPACPNLHQSRSHPFGCTQDLTQINVRLPDWRLYESGFNLQEGNVMADTTTKVPMKTEKSAGMPQVWRPFESLRREVDRLFDDFHPDFWRSPFRVSSFDITPFRRSEATFAAMPAVDVSETDRAYEITADLPGMDEKNVEVKLANGVLTIKGEKQDEKEEKKKDYYMRERSFGSFERTFAVPSGVDSDKIEANFKKGVLSVTLPKSAEAQKAEKKIAVKAA
jgi:HSP20 family protein